MGVRYRVALAAMALLAQAAHATAPPPYQVPAGFINADPTLGGMPKPVQRLPANAKGALFLMRLPQSFTLASVGGAFHILSELPQAPQGNEFSVTEDGRPLGHATVVDRLPIDPRADGLPSARYWFDLNKTKTGSRKLQRCLQRRSAEQCLGLSPDTLASPYKIAEVLNKRFREVSSRVSEHEGFFRIAPPGGFKPGKSYTMRFTNRENLPGMLHPHEIHVAIGNEILRSSDEGFKLVPQGPLQYIAFHANSEWTHTLRFALPPAYERYRSNMLYIVKEFATPDSSSIFHWGRNPLVEQYIWGKPLPRGLERFSAPYLRPGDLGTIGVAGFVGLLEVEDELHRTPHLILEFKLPAAKVRAAPLASK